VSVPALINVTLGTNSTHVSVLEAHAWHAAFEFILVHMVFTRSAVHHVINTETPVGLHGAEFTDSAVLFDLNGVHVSNFFSLTTNSTVWSISVTWSKPLFI